MSDLILMILGGILIPTLLYALGCFIWYKLWPCATGEKCRIVRENDSFAIYDDYFPRTVNPIGHIYIKNNKAEIHIRKTFEDDVVVDYEPVESWLATDEVFKGCMVGVSGADESAGKLSFEALRNWFLAFFSRHDYKAYIEKPKFETETVVPDDVDVDLEDDKDAPKNGPTITTVDRKIFKISEYGSLSKDVEKLFPMRKLLCGYLAIRDDIRRRLDTTVSDGGGYVHLNPKWKETVYLATLIFTLIYVPVVSIVPYNEYFVYIFVASFLVFYLIWFILHEIHVESTYKNTKFTQFLRLLNRCTGMKTSQLIFKVVSIVGIFLSLIYYRYTEFFIILLTTQSYGRYNYNLWKVDDPLLPMLKQNEVDDNKVDDGADDPNPNPALFAINHYDWTISGVNTNNKLLLRLKFDRSEMARLTQNYNNSELLNSDGDPADVARYFVEEEKDSLHMRKIRWYVDNITIARGFTSMQKMQLIFDFVQDRESFERVEESSTTGRLRSAEEILYSKKATAMDRAMLAATIYSTMNYKVNILQTRDGRVALEVAEKENVCKDLCGALRNDVFSYNDDVYYVCDMQEDNFVIGTIPSFKKSDFVRRIVIA